MAALASAVILSLAWESPGTTPKDMSEMLKCLGQEATRKGQEEGGPGSKKSGQPLRGEDPARWPHAG